MAGIQNTSLFKAADRLAEVDPSKSAKSIQPISVQVGNIETTVMGVKTKISDLDSELDTLRQSLETDTFNTSRNVSRRIFISNTLKTSLRTITVLETRLNLLRKKPQRITKASLGLLTLATTLKSLPIPGISLTAGVTSTLSAKLADIRSKGRDLLDSANTIDSLVNNNQLEELREEIRLKEEILQSLIDASQTQDTQDLAIG